MEVTEINLVKNRQESNPVFYADVEIDEGLIIKGFRILKNNESGELFVGMPSQRDPKGKTDSNGRVIYYPTLRFSKDREGNYIGKGEECERILRDKLVEAAHNYSETSQNPERKPPF